MMAHVMRRLLWLPLLALLLPAAADQLDPDVVAKLKAATVFVKLPFGTGTGFVFKKSGTTAYLLTCEHVVGNAETCEVVFDSGGKSERSCTAAVVATDPSRDLACLVLKNVPDLPASLELGTKTAVRETEAVFVAGFPFGEMLSASSRNPEISLTQVTVSSIRKDDQGNIAVVQLSGDVNPGNSGGPAVDSRGRIVGVAQSKIAIGQTCFFVPPEGIREFLKGRVKGLSFTQVSQTEKLVKFQATMALADPMDNLQSVGLAWVRQDEVDAMKEPPQADKDGKWQRVHPGMRELALKISEDHSSAEATFEVVRGSKDPACITLCFQSRFSRGDGAIWTTPGLLDVVFGEGAGGKITEAPVKEEPTVPVGPSMAIPDTLEVAAILPLMSVVGELLLSPDGDHLYALDLSDGKVFKLALPSLKVEQTLLAPDGAVAMALSPDGSRLVVAAARLDAATQGQPKNAGILQVVATKDLGVVSTIAVDPPPTGVALTDKGLVILSVAGNGGLLMVDVGRRAETGRAGSIYGGSCIRLHPDQSRVYTGDRGLSPADFRCVPLKKDPKLGYPSYDSPYHGEHPLGGSFEITPDGRFLLGSGGSVLRLSRTQKADLHFVARIDPFLSAGIAKGCGTFLTTNAEGFLKVYGMDTFELKKSVKAGKLCSRLALDPKRRMLYAAAGAVPDARAGWWDPGQPVLGDIVAYSLDEKKAP
jgi:hypothetical protein